MVPSPEKSARIAPRSPGPKNGSDQTGCWIEIRFSASSRQGGSGDDKSLPAVKKARRKPNPIQGAVLSEICRSFRCFVPRFIKVAPGPDPAGQVSFHQDFPLRPAPWLLFVYSARQGNGETGTWIHPI